MLQHRSCCYFISFILLAINLSSTVISQSTCAISQNTIFTSWSAAGSFPNCAESDFEAILLYRDIECESSPFLGPCFTTTTGCIYQCLSKLGQDTQAIDDGGDTSSRRVQIRTNERLPGFVEGIPVLTFGALSLRPSVTQWTVEVAESLRPTFTNTVRFNPRFLTQSTSLKIFSIQIPNFEKDDLAAGSLPPSLESVSIIGSNSLSCVPEVLRDSDNIQLLQLSDNNISEFDDSSQKTLLSLSNLNTIQLTNNDFVAFPRILLHLPKLKTIFLQGNPLSRFDVTPSELDLLRNINVLQLGFDGVAATDTVSFLCDESSNLKSIKIDVTTYEVCVNKNLPLVQGRGGGGDDDANDDDMSLDDFNSNNDDESSSLTTGGIIGAVIGALLLLSLIVVGLIAYRKRRNARKFRRRLALSPLASPVYSEEELVFEAISTGSAEGSSTGPKLDISYIESSLK